MKTHAQDLTSEAQRIVIIGGGFTGTVMAAQLLRSGGPSVSIVVIERSSSTGRGVAYSTSHDFHLLNVPAGNMSIFPDDPQHFLRWARIHHDSDVSPGAFLPRRLYGQYLEWALREASSSICEGSLQWVRAEAVSLTPSGYRWEVRLNTGNGIAADCVVLCLGNLHPGDPMPHGKRPALSPRYFPYPWSASALDRIENDESILLVGSGLTSIDLALAIRALGFPGIIHMISRRGLLPQSHKAVTAWPAFLNSTPHQTTRTLLRLVREEVNRAEDAGGDWRAVMDSLRPATQPIWLNLPLVERRRFLRHVRPYWEVHRHRMAPAVAAAVGEQLRNRQIQPRAGRITNYSELRDGVVVTYRNRASGREEALHVDRVINCTGPETNYRSLDDPLLRNLQAAALVRPDPLFLGLDVSNDGALIDSNGLPSDSLYAVGPARKGILWETTAVPEIRDQVEKLSQILLNGQNRRDTGQDPAHAESYLTLKK